MKAEELMLLNFVNYPKWHNSGEDKCWMVKSIEWNMKKIWLTDGSIETYVDFYILKPIPITEVWIKYFGLSESENEEGDTIWKNENIEIEIFNYSNNSTSCFLTKVLTFQTEIELRYLHQLQNLYFALTGRQLLTIK